MKPVRPFDSTHVAAPARGSLAHAPGGVDHRTIDIYIPHE